MPSINFLKLLNQKLKTGNRRSIHLNVLPGRYATRLDISKLDIVEENLANDFLEELLSKQKFQFSISYDRVNLNILDEYDQNELNFIVKKLNGMYYQNNDNFSEHGIKTFGFGYPIIIKRDKKDTSKIIKAPLIIWHLDIKKSTRKTNEWKIFRDESYPITFNEVLISHIEQDEGITLKKLQSEYFEDNIIDEKEIVQISKDVLEQLNSLDNNQNFNANINHCPNRDKVENITGNIPWISWSGIFGLFRAQKESIITDIDKLIENYDSFKFEKLIVETYQTSTIAAVQTDPSQEEILNSLTKKSTRIIQGPPGTGKSQSLTAIITNALENGAKCLVVCEKKTALDVIHNNLGDLVLDGLCAVIDDVGKDRKKIIGSVRATIDARKNFRQTFKEQEYTACYKEYNELRSEINLKHGAVLKKVFGDDKWKDVIGKYIGKEKTESKELLRKELVKDNYQFSIHEFQELSKVVKDGKYLYDKINTLNHPLEILNNDIFNGQYLNNTKTDIEDNLAKLASICKEELICLIDRFEEYGKHFINNSKFNQKLICVLSVFSKYYKKLKTIRKEVLTKYHAHAELHAKLSYFPFIFINEDSITNFRLISENLTSYENETTKILEQFKLFQEYFEWKSFFLSKSQSQQDLLISLINISVSDWDSALESWYYDGVLAKHQSEIGPFHQNSRLITKLANLNQKLKEIQRGKIADYWADRQQNSINRYNQTGNISSLYNYRKNNQYQRRNSLRKIIHTDFDLFTDFFPVVMVNPVVASSILPLREGIFDVVIFDEASQLRLEDTYSSFIRGKYKIVSGDVHQMPPSNYFAPGIVLGLPDGDEDLDDESTEIPEDDIEMAEKDSLLHYAVDSKFEKSYLDFHYRSRHPYLIDFSNAAFYGSRLTPMPAKYVYKPIRLLRVNGLYENKTNPAEVEAVIDILFNHIQPGEDGEYPSVGIATFNMEQRNLILEMIQDECFMNNKANSIIEKLRAKGLFVKNLENIQGEERDIIIISTTFGLNSEGKFSQQFGPITHAKGYKLFNVIITRAKHVLYVCTSIPNGYYAKYKEDISLKGNIGKGIFYAYLAYAQSVERNDDEARENILKLLSDNCAEKLSDERLSFVESPFEQEVYEYLTDYIYKERIEAQYKIGGFRIDFVVKSKRNGKPIIAIECDGAYYHSSEEAYAHDMYRQKQIEEEMGFEFFRIWSTNWWIDPQKEIHKLVEFIKSVDSKDESKAISEEPLMICESLILDDELPTVVQKTIQSTVDDEPKKKIVTIDSTVEVQNIHNSKKMTVSFTNDRRNLDLVSTDVKIVFYQSPIAVSLMGKSEGDKIKVGGIEVYYKILNISDAN